MCVWVRRGRLRGSGARRTDGQTDRRTDGREVGREREGVQSAALASPLGREPNCNECVRRGRDSRDLVPPGPLLMDCFRGGEGLAGAEAIQTSSRPFRCGEQGWPVAQLGGRRYRGLACS